VTRAEAVKRLRKHYGDKALYRVTAGAPNADQRAQATAAQRELNEARKLLDEAMELRRAELLNVPDYQAMVAQQKELRAGANRLMGIQHSYRYTIGRAELGFFHVHGQGDTWEEAFTKAGIK
jgi:hypothetical protein